METLILVSLLMQTNNIDINDSLNRNILKSTIVQATITENLPKRKPNLIDDNGWTRTYNKDTGEYDLCYECHPEFFKGDDGQPHLVDYPNYSGSIIYNEQLNKCVPRTVSGRNGPETNFHGFAFGSEQAKQKALADANKLTQRVKNGEGPLGQGGVTLTGNWEGLTAEEQFARMDRVRSVPEPKSFPKNKHQGHNCPTCGQSQYIIASYNGDGTHNHTCRMCGTTWNH